METMESGWELNLGENNPLFMDRISNCRREVSKWRKNNITRGEEKISLLKRALEEI